MNASLRITAFSLLLAVCAFSAQLHDFEGRFLREDAKSADPSKAIDLATQDMSFVTRPLARDRLRKSNKPVPSLWIKENGSNVDIGYGNTDLISCPSNGKSIAWERNGEKAQLSIKLQGGVLVQTFQGEEGAKRNSFQLSPDGNELTLETRITSPRLPAPVVYRTVFRRTP
ncbi:MAG: hypothetical protein RL318_862 [Fibrobacterota bacterium]|jgi:hypothetical protein